ncbi:unnamed protein product [Trichogramma brassicae]|uniref:CCHC-type domain-containing protein n=1 Tax=Trichogramma brassicae TaxID=86971 RepID=A0A6H5IT64_9HYME|nr:unnamed protein product [Trichogramma brassicae]
MTAMSAGLLDLQALSKSSEPLQNTPMSAWLRSSQPSPPAMVMPPLSHGDKLAAITKRIVEAPRMVKDASIPSQQEFSTGVQGEKMDRLEGLIQGLAAYVKEKPAIQLQRFSSCLTQAFCDTLPPKVTFTRACGTEKSTVLHFLALKRTTERFKAPSSQEVVVAASTPSSKRNKRPAALPPEVTAMEKRATGPHPHEHDVDGNNNAVRSEETFTVVKGRRGRRREALQAEEVERGPQPPRPRQRRVRLRPDAIVVKATGTTTYADILRRLYAESAIQETVGRAVQSIRRSAPGAMVLQLRKGVQNVSALGTELDGVLGDAATASALSHKTPLEIRDLDECATREEICTALCQQLGAANLDPDAVRSLRKAYAGTQTAVIDLPDELAAKAIKLGHLRVGWVSCRVRESVEASRCFHCWEIDHLAARCVGPDRSKLCYRCGQDGHRAKTCRNAPVSAQNLLSQTVRELGISVAIVCDQYKNPGPHYTWIADSNKQAAIWVLGGLPVQGHPSRPHPFFTWARVSDVYIFSVYTPPRLTTAEFSALLSNVVEEAQGKRPLIIAGDFNAWSTEWGSSETKPRDVILLDALSTLDVVLLNTGHTPTFTGPQGSSIIDLSFASDSLTPRVAGWRVESNVFTNSDHRAITFSLSGHRPLRTSAGPRRGWSARTLDEEAFSERLSACSASMSGGGSRHRRRHEPVYWWTEEIAALRRQCLRARRLAQRARGRAMEGARLADFAIARGRLRAAIEDSKRRCWIALCDEVYRDVWGQPYGTVMSRLRGPRATPPREPSLVRRTVTALFPTVTEALIRPPAGPVGAVVPAVTLEELQGACGRIRDGAAPGPDGVPNRAFKLAVALRPDAFLQVYSACLSGGVFPSPWKRQRLVLLPKPGKPPDAPSSYRPLCMLDTAWKILERIICNRLEVFTKAPDGLSDHQHGFRRGRSTTGAIESVTAAAREAVGGARGSRKYCAVVTLDVRNAFNSARWNNILAALERIHAPEYLQRIMHPSISAVLLSAIHRIRNATSLVIHLDSERGAVRCVASVGVLPSGSTLKRLVIQVQRPLRRAVMLSDSPPVRSIEKPPPPSRSSPSVAPTDPPSAQLPTKRPVIQVHRPLRRAVVLSDSPPVRCIEKPKSLPPPVTVPTPEELPCIRQLTRPVLVTPEQRPPACETPGKRQPLPPRPAGRELETLPESFRGLAIRTPKLRLNDDVPASDPSD